MASWWGGGSPGGMEDARTPAKKRGYLRLQHRSRVLQLQSQWQEVAEQENRARLRNWQLLQDFQRAQDTLKDLAARTAAMATIRAEYERQLEQRFPHWQQKHEEKRTVAQNKERVELRLKEALRKTEEGSRREGHNRTAKGAHAPLTSPGPSLPTPPILPHGRPPPENGDTHFHLMKNTRVVKEDYAQNYPHTPWNRSTHPSWLTGVHSMSDVPQASDIQDLRSPADLRGLQGLHRAGYPFLHNLCPLVSRSFDPPLLLPQGQPHQGPIMGCPPVWPVLYGGLSPRLQSPYSQVPWPGFPAMDSRDWGTAAAPEPDIEGDSPTKREDREGSEGPESPKDRGRGQQGRRRQHRASDQSCELDIKPVRLSSVHGDSSESSSICSEAPRGGTAGERRRRRETKGVIWQSGMDREEGTSQKSSAGSSVRSLASSGVVRATDASGAPEEAIQRSGMPSAKALASGEEESCGQEEASGVEAEAGVNQGTEEGVETQDSSQGDGGLTGEEEEGEEENGGGRKKEEGEEEVENTAAEEEEGEEGAIREESDVEEDAQEREEGSGDEGSVEGRESPHPKDSEVEGTRGVQEDQAEEEEVGEEVLSSERHRYSEEEEGTEGELSKGDDGSEGKEEGESEVEVGEEEQEDLSQQEKEEDEWGGSDSSEEGEMKEGEVEGEEREKGKCDAVEEDEDDDEGEEGTGKEKGTVAADNRKEESEGTTDSEDEIITSQLDKRKNIVKKADLGMRSKPGAGNNMDNIEEEEEYEDEANDYDDEEDDDDGADIEALLAPKKDLLKHRICDGEEEEGPDPVTTLDEEPKDRALCPQREKNQTIMVKSKALWQESTSGLEDRAPGSANLTAPREDQLEDFDDFYD